MKTYTSNTAAARVIHPGLIVADELDALSMDVTQASQVLGVRAADLQRLYAGESDITPAIAIALETLGSADAAFWLALQANFNAHPKRGGYRVGAGRRKRDLVSKQVRISAAPNEMTHIQSWLNAQANISEALAKLILQTASANSNPKK